jgi:hypothetical protein
MIAILLAAQLSAAVVPELPAQPSITIYRQATAPLRRNLVSPQLLCAPPTATDASDAAASLLRPQDRKNLKARKLADLPRANKEVAVARTIGGCAVPVGVRYSVEGDGRFASGQ